MFYQCIGLRKKRKCFCGLLRSQLSAAVGPTFQAAGGSHPMGRA